jgi:hypothetical protein
MSMDTALPAQVRDIGLGIVLDMLKGGVFGLVAGIALVIVMRKAGLLKREGKVYSALVKLYYLYIPLALTALVAAWFAVSSVRAETFSVYGIFRQDIIDTSVQAAEFADGEITGLTGSAGIDDLSIALISEALAIKIDAALSESLSEYPRLLALIKPVRGAIFKTLVAYISDKLIEELGSFLGENTETWNDVEKIALYGIVGSLRGGLLAEIAEAQMNRLFNGFYGKIRTIGIVLVLPVVIETGIYSFRKRKKRLAANAA